MTGERPLLVATVSQVGDTGEREELYHRNSTLGPSSECAEEFKLATERSNPSDCVNVNERAPLKKENEITQQNTTFIQN